MASASAARRKNGHLTAPHGWNYLASSRLREALTNSERRSMSDSLPQNNAQKRAALYRKQAAEFREMATTAETSKVTGDLLDLADKYDALAMGSGTSASR